LNQQKKNGKTRKEKDRRRVRKAIHVIRIVATITEESVLRAIDPIADFAWASIFAIVKLQLVEIC